MFTHTFFSFSGSKYNDLPKMPIYASEAVCATFNGKVAADMNLRILQ